MKILVRSTALLVARITIISALFIVTATSSYARESKRPSEPEILVGDYECETQSVTVYSVSHHSRKEVRPISRVKVFLDDGTVKKYSTEKRHYEFTINQNDYSSAVNSVQLKFRGRRKSRYAEIDFKAQCGDDNGEGNNGDGDITGCSIADTHVDTVASQQECDALIATYVGAGGGSPEGNAWTRDLWNTPTDPCLWEGVTCDADGVTGLDLSHAYFYPGEIPIELYDLVNLTTLDLASSEIVGLVAPEIEQLTELVELSLLGNYFPTLPPEIGKLSKLETLRMQSLENWSGGFPDEWANLDSLTRLELNNTSVYDNDATPFFAGVIDTLKYLSLYQDGCIKVTDPELDAKLLLLEWYPDNSGSGAWAYAGVNCR